MCPSVMEDLTQKGENSVCLAKNEHDNDKHPAVVNEHSGRPVYLIAIVKKKVAIVLKLVLCLNPLLSKQVGSNNSDVAVVCSTWLLF